MQVHMLIKSKQVHKYDRLFGVFASTYVVTTISKYNVNSFKRIQLVLSFVHISMNLLCWIKLIGSTILLRITISEIQSLMSAKAGLSRVKTRWPLSRSKASFTSLRCSAVRPFFMPSEVCQASASH